MSNKTLVFTATYNESENIKKFLDITLKFKNIDLLIVDDNSPDLTFEIVENYQKNIKIYFLLKEKQN